MSSRVALAFKNQAILLPDVSVRCVTCAPPTDKGPLYWFTANTNWFTANTNKGANEPKSTSQGAKGTAKDLHRSVRSRNEPSRAASGEQDQMALFRLLLVAAFVAAVVAQVCAKEFW